MTTTSGGNNHRQSSPTRFDLASMPSTIHRRELHSYSVHHSPVTGKWIATITRSPCDAISADFKKTLTFSFVSEREARKFAKAYSPPKMMVESYRCGICCLRFVGSAPKKFHCRNCGACICDGCSTRWGRRMIPRTYTDIQSVQALTVRVCTSCDWLSNAFCMALLQGKENDAKQLVDTSNVNLRTCFAAINGESMFPVHCAVMGGNLSILKWLVETHSCPIVVKSGRRVGSVQTSEERSLVDLAMTGKPKLDILRYLIMEKNLSIKDTKDPNLAPKTLEVLLRAGVVTSPPTTTHPIHMIEADTSEASQTTIEDACILCCDKPMDSVLIPVAIKFVVKIVESI
eukprot:CAMPEP_0116868110 /NCGR_PEP_ID=MMETSP0418-20121206/27001_1 /TAXON_ID=1158023 /ORGANISM="Astrosyne radiata, Strain 13vi08-1A" /LENGTH=343 /DNA_ID=CAMNT_0004504017 /DNA_START=184 /DNA_END=1216 /DNA_ORIENTATION=+